MYIKYDTNGKTTYKVRNLYSNNDDDIILYETEGIFATALSGVYKDILYVVETIPEGGKFTTEIVLIYNKDNVKRYKISTMDKIPYVQQIDNLLIINYELSNQKTVQSHLKYFDIDTNELNSIDKNEYVINPSGTITGDYILFASGIENTIYYQVVKYRNEDIEKDGKSHIYKVDKNNIKDPKKIIDLDKKLIFISGDDNIFITSDYIYEYPFYDSGKLYIKNDNSWSCNIIPRVTAGNDIIGAQKINNKTVLIFTSEEYYLYDYDNKKYIEKNYRKESGMYSSIKSSKNKFFYLENINDRYFLHSYEYSAKK